MIVNVIYQIYIYDVISTFYVRSSIKKFYLKNREAEKISYYRCAKLHNELHVKFTFIRWANQRDVFKDV